MPDPVPVAQPLGIAIPTGPLTKSIRSQIESTIAAIVPADKNGAVLAIANMEGATIMVAHRINQHWQLSADVTRKWSGPVSGEVKLLGTW